MAKHDAFEILYREYYVRVFGLCRRLLNSSELAEDATQEAFMRAYRSFKKYDASQPFWQWIATIANNYCIDQLRLRKGKESMFGSEQEELDLLEADGSSIEARAISFEDADAVNTALSLLDDKYRIPLVMAYFSGASYDEIAEQLDVSRNHVGVLLLRGKERLRQALLSSEQGEGAEGSEGVGV